VSANKIYLNKILSSNDIFIEILIYDVINKFVKGSLIYTVLILEFFNVEAMKFNINDFNIKSFNIVD
jgi:hypothetical protein